MIFDYASEFSREVKTLSKKCPSIASDLEIAEQVIATLYADQDGVDRTALRKNFFNNKQATILTRTDRLEAVKMRMDCASLGKKDVLRLIFVFVSDGESVTFVELYSKTNKPREDTIRLQKYMAVPSIVFRKFDHGLIAIGT